MAAADYTPTVADIAGLLTARTTDEYGNEEGTFNTGTKPTATQVEALIADARRSLRLAAGPEIDTTDNTDLQGSAKQLVMYLSAMLVELSYFPEQASADDSVYARYKELYDAGLKNLAGSLVTDPADRQGIASVAVSSPTSSSFSTVYWNRDYRLDWHDMDTP